MNLEQRKISDIEGDFLIEAYQRGYRWGYDEISHLLNDIDEIPSGQPYCLQPVVVKRKGNKWELIDGQQRLTTLYLVIQYLENYIDRKYSIEYTTRKGENGKLGSKELLENIKSLYNEPNASNIDELFIKNAYRIISEWFDGDKKKMSVFSTKLNDAVTIIWYEVDPEEDSIAIFTRLNIGKISLTNAELVKALFLSRGKKIQQNQYSGNPYGIEEKKQSEIAYQWDAMEKQLQNQNFWAFITNEKAERYPIRMELLFDLIEKKPTNESNFYTFNSFYERFKNSDDKYQTWELIVRYMQQLQAWHNDFELYHLIGFLVATGTSIKDLLDLAMNEDNPIRKSQFKETLFQKIRERMTFITGEGENKEVMDYSELNYENHPSQIKDILLLFNVETIRQKGDENNRFPFIRYKSEGTWSLEHIHAQNSDALKTNDQWQSWIELHKKSLENLLPTGDINRDKKVSEVIDKMEDILNHIKDTLYKGSIRDEFNAVSAKTVKLLTQDDFEGVQMHSLSNMALLTVGENAALNNSTFDVKRSKLIEMDRKGDYIPPCTKNVFLKYYSSADTKLHFWADEDRKAYISAMNDVLYGTEEMEKDGKALKLINTKIHYGNQQ